MKPQLVTTRMIPALVEEAKTLPEGVFLANGTRARKPKDTHPFCAGELVVWRRGAAVKRLVAAATESGFMEVAL